MGSAVFTSPFWYDSSFPGAIPKSMVVCPIFSFQKAMLCLNAALLMHKTRPDKENYLLANSARNRRISRRLEKHVPRMYKIIWYAGKDILVDGGICLLKIQK